MQDGHYIVQMEHLVGVFRIWKREELTMSEIMERKMPVDDGNWHQITITFSKENSEFRLYYDGHKKAIYKVNFDFSNKNPFRIGAVENTSNYVNTYSPEIKSGLKIIARTC